MATPVPMVLLCSTTNIFEARVIQAHLVSEGLDAELRGAVDGPYPFTVGGLGEVAVWVPRDQLDDARLVLLAAEVDASVGASTRARTPSRLRRSDVVVIALIVGLVLAIALARVLQLAA